MPIKTDWTTGDILSANQVSTYLANAGLDFITEVFVETSASEIVVPDAFGSAHNNYKIVYQGIDTSTMAVIKFEFLDGNGDPVTTDYSSVAMQMGFGGTTITGESYSYCYVAGTSSGYQFGSMEVFAPFRSDSYSFMTSTPVTSANVRYVGAKYEMQTSFTDFRFVGDDGTFDSGSVAVYGYRLT
jgi:hypothetical protein